MILAVQQPLQHADAGRPGSHVQPGRRLVEHQQPRVGDHRPGQKHLHLLAGGKMREDAVPAWAEPELIEFRLDPPPLCGLDVPAQRQSDRAEEARGDDFADPHRLVERRTARRLDQADPLPNTGQVRPAEHLPADGNAAAAGPRVAAENGNERGLAGAVGPQDRTAGSRHHLEEHVPEQRTPPSDNADILKIDCIWIHMRLDHSTNRVRTHARFINGQGGIDSPPDMS